MRVEGWARGWLIVHKSIDPDTWEAREDSWQVTQTITGLSVTPIDFATFYDAKRVRDALVESDMNWEVTPDLSEFVTSEVRGYLRDMALAALCRTVVRKGLGDS